MTVQTLRLAGKEYTLVPTKDFLRMAKELAHYQAELASDLAVARGRLKDRKDKAVPWAEAKKRLGLA